MTGAATGKGVQVLVMPCGEGSAALRAAVIALDGSSRVNILNQAFGNELEIAVGQVSYMAAAGDIDLMVVSVPGWVQPLPFLRHSPRSLPCTWVASTVAQIFFSEPLHQDVP